MRSRAVQSRPAVQHRAQKAEPRTEGRERQSGSDYGEGSPARQNDAHVQRGMRQQQGAEEAAAGASESAVVVHSLSPLFLFMEPVLFNKVFINDDECAEACLPD